MAEIVIKSSLINDDDFRFLKNSLIEASKIDGKDKFRVRCIEYINDSSGDDEDIFFYDMLEFVRFLKPGSDDTIAYTTPDHLIYLNMPNKIVGENVKEWDFTYDHECLHQLWDTFGVANRIKKEYGEYDHNLLNIASDCVINDYLYFYRKKSRPKDLITPEYISETYGVTYDRKNDTQFTLYLKLKKVKDEQKKLFDKMMNDPIIKKALDDMDNDNQQNNQQGGSNGNSGGNSGGNSDGNSGGGNSDGNSGDSSGEKSGGNSNGNSNSDKSDNDKNGKPNSSGSGQGNKEDNMTADEAAASAQKSADEAKDAADKAKEAADKSGDDADKEGADKAKEAADKAQQAADAAKEAAANGDEKEANKKAKEAKEAADEAKKYVNKNGGDSDDGGGKGQGSGNGDNVETKEDLDKIKKKAADIIDKYKNKISGEFGKFINKCKRSLELKESGLSVGTEKGQRGWNQEMNSYINSYVKKKVFQKRREYELTYKKMNRRAGYVKWGEPIKKGKKLREEKLTINVAFYIDRSGSMSSSIDDVFKAAYTICESLKKQFGKEKVVDEVTFKMHAFDTMMHEIKFGNKMSASGGTMDFDRILEYINNNTKEYLINVIITDAGFSINADDTEKFIKNIDGMILFITNIDSKTMKDLAKKHDTQLFYVLADSNFTLK